jgi:restriction endonuclease S subunit
LDGHFPCGIWRGDKTLCSSRVAVIGFVDLEESGWDAEHFVGWLRGALAKINAGMTALTVKHLPLDVLRNLDVPPPSRALLAAAEERIKPSLSSEDVVRAAVDAALVGMSRRLPLDELGAILQVGYTPQPFEGAATDVRLLRITDLTHGALSKRSLDDVPMRRIPAVRFVQYRLCPGDVLVIRTGGDTGAMFNFGEFREDAVFASYLIRITFFAAISEVKPPPRGDYLEAFSHSSDYQRQLLRIAGGERRTNTNIAKLMTVEVPIGNLQQQNRVVAAYRSALKRVAIA